MMLPSRQPVGNYDVSKSRTKPTKPTRTTAKKTEDIYSGRIDFLLYKREHRDPRTANLNRAIGSFHSRGCP